MIDIHNHIIYSFDDGPATKKDALEMIRIASDQGITAIFATSHFTEVIQPEVEVDYFAKLKILRNEVKKQGISVDLYSGSEMFYHHFLERTIKKSKVGTLCGLGLYVLMEFPLYLMPSGVEETLFKLNLDEVIPIIAHPERYSAIIEEPEKVMNLLKHGGLLQVNVGSVLGKFGRKVQKVAMWLLENRMAHFLGSDAHSPKGRSFELAKAAQYLEAHLEKNYIRELVEFNPRKIIDNEKLEKPSITLQEEESGLLQRMKRKLGLS